MTKTSKKMKKSIIFIAVLFSTAICAAQEPKIMYIMKNNAVTHEIAISDIDSIVFYKPETPPVVITPDDFFQNEENVKVAVTGAFANFSDFVKQFYLIEALYSNVIDLEESQGSLFYTYRDILNHTIVPINTQITDLWANAYKAIRMQNFLLDKLDKEKYSNYLYTVSVLQAYTYFTIINCWGNVPFVNEQNYDSMDLLSQIGRTPEGQILSVLVNKLLDAEKNLPDTEVENSIYFSKSFAQFLLAKIYTYQKNYIKALEYTTKIIGSGYFSLSANVIDIYNDKRNVELITKLITTYVGVDNSQNQDWISMIQKGNYMPFARYAEVILLASENNLKIGNSSSATYCLNLLRVRNNRSLLNTNNNTEIENAIIEEYKQDIGKEGVYFFALKRFDMAEKILNIESYRKLFPIPMREVILNPNMTQNEGY